MSPDDAGWQRGCGQFSPPLTMQWELWLQFTGIWGEGGRAAWELVLTQSHDFSSLRPLVTVEALERQNGKVLCQNHLAPRRL